MSCNGCRVLRKGCSEACILRPCIQWIDSPQAQCHATLFVAKFFGRAGLVSFISNVPDNQRPALFQSLLYEACGRTVSPVSGAAGLLLTGNWQVCQAAVDTVLRGGTLKPIPEFLVGAPSSPTTTPDSDEVSEVVCPPKQPTSTWHNQVTPINMLQDLTKFTVSPPRLTNSKRRRPGIDDREKKSQLFDPALIPPPFDHAPPSIQHASPYQRWISVDKQRPGTASFNSEESATTVSFESGIGLRGDNFKNSASAAVVGTEAEPQLLELFV